MELNGFSQKPISCFTDILSIEECITAASCLKPLLGHLHNEDLLRDFCVIQERNNEYTYEKGKWTEGIVVIRSSCHLSKYNTRRSCCSQKNQRATASLITTQEATGTLIPRVVDIRTYLPLLIPPTTKY